MPGLTEIRVHGVGGATAAQLLDDPDPRQSDGDRVAGFFSSRQPAAPHSKEAYVWGGLTSKALVTGFWWLLLPFTLANISGWMIRPIDQRWRASLTKVLIWVIGVGMTIVYVSYIVVIVMDVGAVRCGGNADCVNRWWLTPLTWFPLDGIGHPVWRVAVGGGAVVLLLGLLFGVSTRNRRVHETFDSPDKPDPDNSERKVPLGGPDAQTESTTLGDRNFWYLPTDLIFRIHLLVATATVGFAVGTALWAAVDQSGWPKGSRLVWLYVVAVAAALIIGYLAKPDRLLWDRDTARHKPRDNYVLGAVAWVTGHITAAAAAGLIGWFWRQGAPSSDAFAEQGFMQVVLVVAWAYFGLVVTLIFVTAPEEGFARKWRSIRHRIGWGKPADPDVAEVELREAGFRFLPVPTAVGLGLFMTFAGFSAVLVRVVAFLEGGNSAELATSLMGGNSSYFAFSAIVTVVFGLWWLSRDRSSADPLATVRSDYGLPPSDSPREQAWVKRVVAARRGSEAGRNADVLLFLFLLVFGLVLATLALSSGPDEASSPLFGWSWLETTGSWLLLLYLFPGVFVMRAALRARDTRRSVGKVWDVLTFWPRIYHPLAAPCYAERAVPELRDRIRAKSDQGEPVILSAHSQGTVIAYAALEQVKAEQAEGLRRVAVVTYGSPINQLFVPFFPGYFKPDDMQKLAENLCPRAGWVNFYRDTDYIGKRLFPAADRDTPGTLPTQAVAADVRLLDPEKPLLPAQRHSNYEKEPLLEQWVERVTKVLLSSDSRRP